MEETNIREFRINDMYQAVVLKVIGLELLTLERDQGNQVTFVFNDPNIQARKIVDRYWRYEVKVDAREMVETINELKTRIYTKTL